MSPPRFRAVRCSLPATPEEALAEVLQDLEVLGCEIVAEDAGRREVVVYLEGAESEGAVGRALRRLGASGLRCAWVEDTDWMAVHREQVRAFPVGRRLWVDPRPQAPTPAPDGRVRLVVEPRTAFGSGSHESTQLLLWDLEDRDLAGASVLDVGAGSGILSLAADALGATWVVAVELDVEAVWVARETALAQDRVPRLQLVAGTTGCLGDVRFQLILCNVISSLLLGLLSELSRLLAVGGEMALSGLLTSEADLVRGVVEGRGLQVIGTRELGDWASLRVRHG